MAMFDVTVMGAGVFGLSVAYACASRGAKVRVIEAVRIGAGSSGGLVGALAPHTPERWDAKKEFQYQSLAMAEAHWREVDRLSGVSSGYRRIGRLHPIATERVLALSYERVEYAREMWRGLAEWRVVKRAEYGAWAPQSPTGYLVHDTLSARMQPRGAAMSLAGAVVALGGEILIGEGVVEGKVVWATGYRGLLALSKEFGVEIGSGVKGQSVLLGYDAGDVPQLFSDGIYVVPHSDRTVAVGSTSERYWDDPVTVDGLLDAFLEQAFAAFPVLKGAEVLERWAGVRPRGRKLAPMLGAYPGRDGHFIANGGFKIGFGMALKVGEVMAGLVLDGDTGGIPDAFAFEANM
ncbi:MAG: FAD-dependent oxidoreductase [Marinosulfonomonas sp.]|nr:MAG: FAD-dependent oxidoreductase [Marinosulfonomonas sp.]